MTVEIVLLLGVLFAMAVLFFTEKLPIELTAFLGLVFLTLGGYVTPTEAFTGFASPAVITMLSIFFVSGALLHTGVADMIGGRVHRIIGSRETLLVVAIMVVAGVLSAFMNNVAAVAVLLPAVASIARRTQIAPSRLFMPLSFGAILGGTMTLVGTPPNILAADLLRERGLEPFGLFDYTPIGVVLLGFGVVYMITVGRWMLPKRDIGGNASAAEDLVGLYALRDSMFGVRVPAGSTLVGMTLGESGFGHALDAQVVGIIRGGKRQLAPGADTALLGDDVLLVEGHPERLRELFEVHGLEIGDISSTTLAENWGHVRCIGIRISSESSFVGQTLRDLRFRERHGALVVGIRRGADLIDADLRAEPIQARDELLVLGTRAQLESLTLSDDLKVSLLHPGNIQDLRIHLFLLRVHAGSPLAGRRIRDSHIGELAGLTVVGIKRKGAAILGVEPDKKIRAADQLLVTGDPGRVRSLLRLGDVQLEQDITRAGIESDDVGIVEVTLAPRSRVVGRTLAEIGFRQQHGLQVLAIWRRGRPIHEDLANQRLKFGDALLVQGAWSRIRVLGTRSDYVVLSSSAQTTRRTRKAPLAVGALAVMIGMVVTGFMPIHVAAFTAATLVVLLGTITMEEAYRSVEWKAVFLVAAILPMGIALERTGAAVLASDAVTAATGGYGPYAAMAGLFTLSSFLSQCLDGAPAVVMMTPVVLEASDQLGISPRTLMMGISVAASAAFMTPFSHKANLLVMGSGGYRTADYLRVGTPLTIVLLAVMVFGIPMVFPIDGGRPPTDDPAAAAGTTESAPIDEHSMLPQCQAVLAGDDTAAAAIAAHPLVDKMSRGMAPQVSFTPEEFATAAFADPPDERFSFARLRENAAYVTPFGEHIAANRQTLIRANLDRATEFLAVELEPEAVTLNIVCGSPWDAFVLIFDGPEIFFDLGYYADAELDQALPGFESILTHELWHQAFLHQQQAQWPVDYHQHEDPATLFVYRMLNEGVGHYYSLYPRLYPTVGYEDFDDRIAGVFALLEHNYPLYLADEDPDAQRTQLWHSHAGVPFWEKWGAVPGALVVYYLAGELGKDGVRDLIVEEPFTLFLTYADLSATRPTWPRLPPPLVLDIREARQNHLRD